VGNPREFLQAEKEDQEMAKACINRGRVFMVFAVDGAFASDNQRRFRL
jgi:hypothetical protein